MIQIQVSSVENAAAVLASILIPLKDVETRELDFLLWQAVKDQEHDNAWHPDFERHRVNAFGMRLLLGEVMPLAEIKRSKRAVTRAKHYLSMSLK